MERLIDLIVQCSMVKGACTVAGISWDEAWGIMQRAVVRGQQRKVARPIRYIGVDEKAFRKGPRYHTVVCDLERSTVEFVAPDRKTDCLAAYYARVLRFATHPITNGVAEGLNSKIMSIKRKAGGFRNPAHFTTAIHFHCGWLDLYPR